MQLVRELRRRRVVRTAALYVIGAWLVLQVADVVFPGFGIPDTAIRVLVWTAVLGFPLALVFGWFFDIGAGGIRRTPPLDSEVQGDPTPLGRVDFVILGACALVAGALVYNAAERVLEAPAESVRDTANSPPRRGAEKLANSIAVLAFDNISNDADNEAFCEGVSEEILNKLSGFRALNVIGRTSSFALKDSNYDIPRISDLLGVHYVLQGSVRKYGEALRIAVQLLDEQGRQVWSQTFDRKLRNVFAIQTEIAEAVASRAASDVVPRLAAAREPDIGAYEAYVAGRDLLRRRLFADARQKLEQAVDLDGDFAEAHAELAIALLVAPHSKSEAARAQESIARALELNPALLRGRAAQGLAFLQQQPPDYARAEDILRDVLDQEPNMSDARLWLVGALTGEGREAEALADLQKAAQLDPLHASVGDSLAQALLERGDADHAIRVAERLLEQPQPAYVAFISLRYFYRCTGRLVDMNRIAKSTALAIHGPQYWGLAESYAVLGQWTAVDYWLQRSVRDFPNYPGVSIYPIHRAVWQGRYGEAVRQFRELTAGAGFRLSEESRDFSLMFGALLARSGEYAAAIEILAPLIDTLGPSESSAAFGKLALDGRHGLAWSYIQTGATAKAAPLLDRVARECRELDDTGRLHRSDMVHYCAENALLQSRQERALQLFDLAVRAGWHDYYVREHDPYWTAVRGNPRYRQLMASVKADVDRQRAAVESMDAKEGFAAALDASIAGQAVQPSQSTHSGSTH